MSIIVAEKPKHKRDPISEGQHIARMYLLCDVGTHYSERYDKSQHKLILGWEVPGERAQFTRDDGTEIDLPRAKYGWYTASLGPKANLRKLLDQMRGKKFAPEELVGFEMKAVLGVPSLVQILHEAKEDGGIKDVLSAAMPLPKGMEAPAQENEFVWYDFDEHGLDIPENVYDWIADEIKSSDEYKALLGNGASAVADEPAPDFSEPDENLPF